MRHLPTRLSYPAGPVCSSFMLKTAPFCKLSSGLNNFSTSVPFSTSQSLTFLSSIFFSISHSLAYLAGAIHSPVHCSIRLQWVFSHILLPRNDTADEVTRPAALLQPFTVHVVSHLSYLLFSGSALSHLKSSTLRSSE